MRSISQILLRLLVAIQLMLLFLLVATGPLLPDSVGWLIIELGGISLGLWSFWYMSKRGTFRIKPQADEKTILLTEGPYRYIRHPMYAGILLITLALSFGSSTLPRTIVSIILTSVLLLKIEIEEVILTQYFPQYTAYMKNTKKIFPFIY